MRWLPAVPEHWNEQRAKTFFREVDERSKTGQEELLSVSHLTGVTPRSQKKVTMFKAASYVGSKMCHPGDIVINTLWAWMAALGASKHIGIVSPAYGVYRPHHPDSFNPAYLDYLLRTRAYVAEYIGRSTGIRASRLRLYPNQFLDITLIQPPRPEQDQIVAYLRAQDAHIARYIKAKRNLINLLTEQKLRIIDHAVTRGLDASVALKPSGIEWLGDVPEHWEVKPLKRWVQLNASTLGEKTNPDFEFRYVDIGSVQTGRLVKELERIRFESAPSRARRVLRRGDTIISTVRTYLKAIWYVSEDADELIASTGFAVLTPGKSVEPEYLGYVIQSSAFVNRVAANSIGIAYPAIAETVLGRFHVALPPTVDEQQAIVAHIKTESKPLDEAIARADEEIKLIREYRDRLIADVVTGQVDVRGWQPGPNDVVADEELAALSADQEDVAE
ncbi:restriction endonuclease subunit S [Castellaniella ginsengisoli]|uniref:Restriction endonuclease subunit S n=1 Tax=Castellaniella ginsengisoli TaxID=546114 RepID=A0AB39CMQ3_9BURK